jgi:hypothetical protein
VNGVVDRPALRMTLGVLVPGVIALSALLPLWVYRDRLPEPLATHWSFLGRPDSAMPLTTLTTIIAAMVVPAVLCMTFLAYRKQAHRGEVSPPMAIAGFLAGLVAVITWLTVSANLDAATWRDAADMGFVKVALSLSVGVALAAIIARVSRPLESPAAAVFDVPHAGTTPGSRAVWVGSARARWALPLTLGCLALAVVLARVNMLAGVGAALTSLVGLWFTSIRMTVDRHGVRIAYGPMRWPVQRLPLAEIRQAAVLHVHPMAWGGWGYRGSLKVLRQAAVVLRGGEGVKLELSGDRTFVITIDGAREAAGLINDLIRT